MTDDIDSVSLFIGDVSVPPALPRTDDDSRAVLAKALESLVLLRFPLSLGDATAELHCLASMIAEAKARIPDAVADARDQDHRWEEIATSLGIGTRTVRRRFAIHARSRLLPMND
jgi:hypothetical protein